jgi:Tfp pilus assembly protein PilN
VPENAWFQGLQLTASDPGVVESKTEVKEGEIAIEGKTYSFEDVSRLVVRLQLIPSLADVTLTSANQAQDAGESGVEVKGFSIGASVSNTQLGGALPLTDVEVQGQ